MRRFRHARILGWIAAFIVVWVLAAQTAVAALRLVQPDPEPGASPLECGRRLSSVSSQRISLRSVRVLIAIDEEWRDRFGDAADTRGRSLVSDVSGLYRDVGLHFLPVRVVDWASPDHMDSAEGLLLHLDATQPLDDADILIGLTGQHLPRTDGFALVGGSTAVAGHHPQAPARDVFVLAHEVGHLFGAHHGCDIPGMAGVMAQSGFDDPLAVCPCTRLVLEANVDRFHDD